MKKLTVLKSLFLSLLVCVSLLGIYLCIVFLLPTETRYYLIVETPITFFVFLGMYLFFFILFSVLARKWKFLGIFLLSNILLTGVLFSSIFFVRTQQVKHWETKRGPSVNTTNQKDCESLDNRVWLDGKCRYKCKEGEIRDKDGYCVSCPETYVAWSVSESECLKCSNAEFFNDHCVPKKCLNEKYPLKNTYSGRCESCSDKDFRYSEEDCARCSNREMKNGYCVFRNSVAEVEKQDKLWKIPYVNGIEHGTVEVYSPDGSLFETFERVNGVANGPAKTFNKNGEIVSTFYYKDGKQEGKQIYYPHADGKTAVRFGVRQETDFVNGKREGFFRIYLDNGQIIQETQFKDDKENGYERLYNENGSLSMESEFKDGKMIKSFCYTDKGEKRELTGSAFINFANGGIDRTCDD